MTSDDKDARKRKKERIDKLLQVRANHTAIMLERGPASSIKGVKQSEGKRPDIRVFAVCARELEWLQPEVKLAEKPARRVDSLDSEEPQLWAEYASSVLTMISKERFYVAAKPEPPGTREVFPVSSVKAERVPYELKFRNIKAAWFQHRPQASPAGGGASLTARRFLVRSTLTARRLPIRSSRR